MTAELLEYPEEVIVRYMQLVTLTSGAMRDQIERPLTFAWRLHPFVLSGLPLSIMRYVTLHLGWRAIVRGATRTTNETARGAYDQFFRGLKTMHWTAGGRANVAKGLLALRSRQQNVELALSLYSHMERAVPRVAIGWSDATAP